jgi:hypothetical protein
LPRQFLSINDTGSLTVGASRITGHFAVASVQNGKLAWTFVEKR